ncbi:MAG: glycerol-3-phosphate acyltransferase [Clostridia bacterium]|nr:glycerol-3-phosphate acyltransferase [Clostridia bacterium]
MDLFNCITISYLIGCINPAYFIARIKGFDIRESGSGNAGGSNALITMGRLIGVFCMIFDIFKAYFAVMLAGKLCGSFTYAYVVSTVSCIFGHIFPFYLRFRGGKGLACLGGCVFAYSPIVFVIMLSAEAVIALVTDYICFVPLTASVAYPVVYGCLSHDVPGAILLTSVTLVMFAKHRENIGRIKNGTEIKLSYLWHGEDEMERIKKNSENK